MTEEKKKAKEIVEKFLIHSYQDGMGNRKESAKACALIHYQKLIDEVEDMNESIKINDEYDCSVHSFFNKRIESYHKIIKEVNAL